MTKELPFTICCDECERKDGEYEEDLVWSKKTKRFICKKGHSETWQQATRHIDFGEFENYFKKIAGFKK